MGLVGKIFTTSYLETIKENAHRVLDTYTGLEVNHYRLESQKRDIYGDLEAETFTLLGTHLLRLSGSELDTLLNGEVHYEAMLPLEVLLDPTVVWKEHDEVEVTIERGAESYSQRFELVKIRTATHGGMSLYQMASMAPVRTNR